MIYLDHNATSPMDLRVLEAMQPFMTSFYGNPSSLYRLGRVVRSALDTARCQVAALVGAQPSEVIFTSGGTEANNLAIKGSLVHPASSKIFISKIEHPSVLEAALSIKDALAIEYLNVDHQGVVDFKVAPSRLAKRVNLVSVMMANNETGVIQPIAQLAEYFKTLHAPITLHTDAVQALGKIPIDIKTLSVDMLSLSSHKIYGPKGVGALVVRQPDALTPLLIGGGQEYGLRAGTENVPAIIGFGKAAEIAQVSLMARSESLRQLKNYLEKQLREQIPGVTIFSERVERLPNTVQFAMPAMDGEMILMQLDKKGCAVSSGSACASGGEASHVLLAMGVDAALAKSAVRVSFGEMNTKAEIDQFMQLLKSIINNA
jgi:cysteine desulfurase